MCLNLIIIIYNYIVMISGIYIWFLGLKHKNVKWRSVNSAGEYSACSFWVTTRFITSRQRCKFYCTNRQSRVTIYNILVIGRVENFIRVLQYYTTALFWTKLPKSEITLTVNWSHAVYLYSMSGTTIDSRGSGPSKLHLVWIKYAD